MAQNFIKPNHPTLAAMESACASLDAIEKMAAAIKAELDMATARLANIEDPELRGQIARYAYWKLPRVNGQILGEACTGGRNVHKLKALVGECDVEIRCCNCDTPLDVTTRGDRDDKIKKIAESKPVTCRDCYYIVRDRLEAEEALKAQLSTTQRATSLAKDKMDTLGKNE